MHSPLETALKLSPPPTITTYPENRMPSREDSADVTITPSFARRRISIKAEEKPTPKEEPRKRAIVETNTQTTEGTPQVIAVRDNITEPEPIVIQRRKVPKKTTKGTQPQRKRPSVIMVTKDNMTGTGMFN